MEKLFNKVQRGACDAFKNLKKNENKNMITKELISFIEKLWQDYNPYADRDFPEQFQRDLDSRFWEMYLTCTLLYKSLPVTPRSNRPNKGPDILIENNDNRIWVEATARGCGEFINPDRVEDFEMGRVINILDEDEKIILRFTGAIKDKFEQYKDYLAEGVVSSSDAYIIAINSCKINIAECEVGIPRIIRSLIGQAVKRKSGEKIETNFFLNPEYENISGIIFSSFYINSIATKKCFGLDHNYGEDLLYIHNPMAKNPIPEVFFKFGTEVKIDIDNEKYLLHFKSWDRPFFREYKLKDIWDKAEEHNMGDVIIGTNIPFHPEGKQKK